MSLDSCAILGVELPWFIQVAAEQRHIHISALLLLLLLWGRWQVQVATCCMSLLGHWCGASFRLLV